MRCQTTLKYFIGSLIIIQIGILLQNCKTESPEIYDPGEEEITISNKEILYSDYFGSESCLECHVKEFYEWRGSHHDESMEVAVDSTVKGDFNNVTFFSQGQRSYFYKKDGKFFVNTEGPNGKYLDYEIKYTFEKGQKVQWIIFIHMPISFSSTYSSSLTLHSQTSYTPTTATQPPTRTP